MREKVPRVGDVHEEEDGPADETVRDPGAEGAQAAGVGELARGRVEDYGVWWDWDLFFPGEEEGV